MRLRRVISVIIIAIFITTGLNPLGPADEAFASSSGNLDTLTSIVQKYEAKSGKFRLTEKSRFFYVSDRAPDGEIRSTIRLLDSEFAAKKKPSSNPLPIIYGRSDQAKDGDIVITIDPKKYEREEYKLVIGKKTKVYAGDADGLFYALRTLLQYRICSNSNTLKACVIRDYPDVNERVAHLDCARKYFSKSWIKNFIRKMSWQKYNTIELHFSEDQALRLESKKFPWLAGTDNENEGVLTQEEMKEICRVARKYHIEIVPSFDSPGHLNYMVKRYARYVKKHPDFEFTYNGKKYNSKRKGFKNISNYFKYNGKRTSYNNLGINLANSTARAFTWALIEEYADFFKEQGCTRFNIGGDELLGWDTVYLSGRSFYGSEKWYALQHWEEYAKKQLDIKNGSAADTFIWYMNKTAEKLEKKGYKCRMWNDEAYRMNNQHEGLKRSIDIVYWSNGYAPLSKLKKKNFSFYNAISTWTYYVTKPCYKYVTGKHIYNGWNPKCFSGPTGRTRKVPKDQYKGAYFCIWCDYASINSTSDIWDDVHRLMWSSSAKMWNGKKVSYRRYKKYVDKISSFPGYSGRCTKNSTLPKPSEIKKSCTASGCTAFTSYRTLSYSEFYAKFISLGSTEPYGLF